MKNQLFRDEGHEGRLARVFGWEEHRELEPLPEDRLFRGRPAGKVGEIDVELQHVAAIPPRFAEARRVMHELFDLPGRGPPGALSGRRGHRSSPLFVIVW